MNTPLKRAACVVLLSLVGCGVNASDSGEDVAVSHSEALSVNVALSNNLTWYRDRSAFRNVADTQAYANTAVILANTGWRLPTQAEAQAFVANKANIPNYQDWINYFGNYIVTSTPYGGGTFGIRLSDGSTFVNGAGSVGYMALVHTSIVNIVQTGGLTWYRDRSALRNYADSVTYCSTILPSQVVGIGGGGWRLPTQAEAQAFVANSASIPNYQDWINQFGNYLVTSTPYGTGTFGIRLSDGSTFVVNAGNVGYNACVR